MISSHNLKHDVLCLCFLRTYILLSSLLYITPRRSSRPKKPGRPPTAIHLGGRSKHIDNDSLIADSGLHTSTLPKRSFAQNDDKKDVRITRNRPQKPATRRSTRTSTLKAKHTNKKCTM